MKEFSPIYLIKAAYDATATAAAKRMLIAQGKKPHGSKFNEKIQAMVKSGEATPTVEEYTAKFKELCARHKVEIEGGIDEFVAGSIKTPRTTGNATTSCPAGSTEN